MLSIHIQTKKNQIPELCRFLGIVIKMFYNDHKPPHFHAVYGDYEASFSIETLEIIKGHMPARVQGLIVEWGTMHKKELIQNWKLYSNNPKNRFLTASALPLNFCLRSCLAYRKWSFAPDKNSGEPPCQNPDSSGCLGIVTKKENQIFG